MDYHQNKQQQELLASLQPASKSPVVEKVLADANTCLELHVLPSGDLKLVCKHSGREVKHLGKVYVAKVNHDPKDTEASVAELKVTLKVPVKSGSKDPFELHGKYLDAVGCDCDACKAQPQAQPKGK